MSEYLLRGISKMRVLILSHMYPNAVSPLGGIFVCQQAVALSKLGVEVTVIAPVPWVPGFMVGRGKWGGYPSVPYEEQPDGFPVFHPQVLEFPRSLFFEYYPQTFAWGVQRVFEEQIKQGVDIIHAHVAHPDGAAALKFGKKFKIPVVVTIHGQDFAYTLNRSKTCAESVRSTLRDGSAVIWSAISSKPNMVWKPGRIGLRNTGLSIMVWIWQTWSKQQHLRTLLQIPDLGQSDIFFLPSASCARIKGMP